MPPASALAASAALTDEALVQLVRGGDEVAFALLVARHRRGVHALAQRFLGSEQDADDAVQETFARVYARLHTYTPTGRFGSWLLAICAHWCLDALRARRRRVATIALEPHPTGVAFISEGIGPEEHAIRLDTRAEVRRWLATLPPEYRAVLTLRYAHDHSYAEIATTLDLPVSTVRMRLLRARNALRNLATH